MKENIEEDIKVAKKLIETMKQDKNTFKDEQSKEIYAYFINALEHILSDYKRVLKENEELKQSLIINKNLYEELCNKNNELKRDNELAKETLKKQCNIADERNQLLKENKDWQRAYQEEKDKQFELLRENQKLNEYIILAPNLDEMTAMKYRNITEEAYIKGRAEEQQKAEQIIYEHYIPKQKIKDKIEELKEKPLTINENNKYYYETDAYNKIIIQVLQDLLEEKGE